VAGEQILENRDRFDHDRVAVLQRGNEAGGIDAKEIAIILDGEQIDRAQPISQSQFLEQPNDPEATTFAIDGEHGSPGLGWMHELAKVSQSRNGRSMAHLYRIAVNLPAWWVVAEGLDSTASESSLGFCRARSAR
jgi:hypothetical protein